MEPQMVVRIMANIDGLKEALAQGGSAIQNTTAGMQRMVASFSGDKLIQQAVNMAAAIDKIGGASKLTESELARANAIFEKAAAKMTALGDTGAAAMQKLAESTRAAQQPLTKIQEITQTLGSTFTETFAGFLSAQAILNAVSGAFNLFTSAVTAAKDAVVNAVLDTAKLGDQLLTLSNKTGVSVERLSEWRYIAGQTGTSVEQITGSIFKLQTELGEGGKKTQQAISALGLSLNQLKTSRPDEAFEQVLSKLRQVPNVAEQSAIGVALFGKGFKDMANLTREDIGEMMENFEELGGSISTELSVAGDAFNDALADWGVLVERVSTSIGGAILPAATAFARIMVELVQKALSDTGASAKTFEASVSDAFGGIVDASGLLLQALASMMTGVTGFFSFFANQISSDFKVIGTIGSKLAGLLLSAEDPAVAARAKVWVESFEAMKTGAQSLSGGVDDAKLKIEVLAAALDKIGQEMKGKGSAALEAVKKEIAATAAAMRQSQEEITASTGLMSDATKVQANSLVQLENGLNKLNKEWAQLTPVQQANTDIINKAIAVYSDLRSKGLTGLPEKLGEVVRQFFALNAAITSHRTELDKVRPSLDIHGRNLSEHVKKLESFNLGLNLNRARLDENTAALARQRAEQQASTAALTQMITTQSLSAVAVNNAVRATEEHAKGMAIWRANAQSWRADAEKATKATQDFGLSFEIAGQIIQDFGQDSETASAAARVMGLAVQVANGMAAQSQADVAQAAAEAALEVGNLEEAQKQQALASQLAAQASISYGMAIIGLIQQIGQYVMAQQAAEAATYRLNRAQKSSMLDLLNDLTEAYGSLQAVQELSRALGVDLSSFIEQASGPFRGRRIIDPEQFREAIDMMEQMLDAATSVMQRSGMSWADMPKVADRLRMATQEANKLNEAFRGLVAIGFDASQAAAGMAGDLNDWLAAALKAGIEIPGAFRPMLEALIRSGELSEENARRLLGLAETGVPSLEAVTAAAERYGIALEDLGPKVQQLQIDEAAKQLVDDWTVLSAATEDWAVLFEAMGEDVQRLVDDAIRYGAELPASMRPMLEAFIEAGQLVDENGNKLTDISQLNFAEDLTQQVDRLIEKLNELIGAIKGGVEPVLKDLGVAGASGMKAIGDAAVATAATIDQTKSRFAEGYAEVIGNVDDLGERFALLPESVVTDIVTTGVEDAKQKVGEFAEIVKNIPKQVRIDVDAGDIEAAGYKTIQQLEDIARRAGVIYNEMARSGKFNAAELERAFKAWQTAINNINPEPLSRAAAAGYQTRDALMAAARESESLWREMVASGLYTTETLQRAWEAWQDDLAAAGMGGMSKAIRSELEGLQKYVESELPEFNELGERIFGVEEQRAIDRIKEIEAQAKAAQESMEGTAEKAGVTIGQTGEAVAVDVEEKSKGAIQSVDRMGKEGEAAFKEMEISAEAARKKLLEVGGVVDDIQTILDESDYGEAFRRAKEDVDDLIDAINRIPGWSGDGGSRGMADYGYRTASSDTLGPSVSYRSVPMPAADRQALDELRAIRRQLADQQPDIVIVPMVTGDADAFENRMAETMPRRVTRSANLRNAWQRAVNGTA